MHLHSQRYVSDELTHFVGRGKSEAEQYDILVNKILKSGWLTYPPHQHFRPRQLGVDFSQPISTDQTLKAEVICFCDIPEADLAIHMSKYSRFGLSFKKQFLIGKGACPVFYIANDSTTSMSLPQLFAPPDFMAAEFDDARKNGVVNRALLFGVAVRQLLDILTALDALAHENDEARLMKIGGFSDEFKQRFGILLGLSQAQISAVEKALRGNTRAILTIATLRYFLLSYLMSFFKCFDASRSIEDEANYYMEREWRVANNIHFGLDDVSRVFLPAAYARKLRADVPNYFGQLSFV